MRQREDTSMRDLAPQIVRQRLLIEAVFTVDVDEPFVDRFLHGLAEHLDLRRPTRTDHRAPGRERESREPRLRRLPTAHRLRHLPLRLDRRPASLPAFSSPARTSTPTEAVSFLERGVRDRRQHLARLLTRSERDVTDLGAGQAIAGPSDQHATMPPRASRCAARAVPDVSKRPSEDDDADTSGIMPLYRQPAAASKHRGLADAAHWRQRGPRPGAAPTWSRAAVRSGLGRDTGRVDPAPSKLPRTCGTPVDASQTRASRHEHIPAVCSRPPDRGSQRPGAPRAAPRSHESGSSP